MSLDVQGASRNDRLIAAGVIINDRLAAILHLQEKWDRKLLMVFHQTARQHDDTELVASWRSQLQVIQAMCGLNLISSIPGKSLQFPGPPFPLIPLHVRLNTNLEMAGPVLVAVEDTNVTLATLGDEEDREETDEDEDEEHEDLLYLEDLALPFD
ncbi:hypothetical protein CROQUDRAFT_86158 [Cronartium quercuum f. sp. fusiforme G11]|uniref:Uncharacterized protein n=1 Tax=Cronartium quercuum f. sp. fusiforme G11 TaxID=708437 RepID=A0A9P6NTG4_9BASI|nr:hypothetical protein CROQUDRAFT_86158 [Cronartium quercuum f. sp. fusiforme G11]